MRATLSPVSQTASENRRISLLGRIIDIVDGGEKHATPGMLMSDAGDGQERAAVTAARALHDQGWISLDERYSGGWAARPLGLGRDVWADFVVRRGDVAHRQVQIRNDYLRWVYEQTRDVTFADSDQFLRTGPSFLGDPYSMSELMRAGTWLADRGFIDGPGSDQRPDPIRPKPTVEGEDWVERGRDVNEDYTQPAATSYVINGDAQIAHQSQHVVQFQSKTAGREGAERLADMLEQLAGMLDADSASEVRGFAVQLRDEASDAARPARFREIGDAATKAFSTGLGGALGSAVLSQITTWIGTLS